MPERHTTWAIFSMIVNVTLTRSNIGREALSLIRNFLLCGETWELPTSTWNTIRRRPARPLSRRARLIRMMLEFFMRKISSESVSGMILLSASKSLKRIVNLWRGETIFQLSWLRFITRLADPRTPWRYCLHGSFSPGRVERDWYWANMYAPNYCWAAP